MLSLAIDIVEIKRLSSRAPDVDEIEIKMKKHVVVVQSSRTIASVVVVGATRRT